MIRHRPDHHTQVNPGPIWRSYLDQARWLVEQHQARDSRFQQAGVGLMTLDGVMLSVIVASSLQADPTLSPYECALAVVAGSSLVVSAVFAALVWLPRSSFTVSTRELVEYWRDLYRTSDAEGPSARPDQLFAQQLLEIRTDGKKTPIIAASELATHRGILIRTSVIATMPALVALLALFISRVV